MQRIIIILLVTLFYGYVAKANALEGQNQWSISGIGLGMHHADAIRVFKDRSLLSEPNLIFWTLNTKVETNRDCSITHVAACESVRFNAIPDDYLLDRDQWSVASVQLFQKLSVEFSPELIRSRLEERFGKLLAGSPQFFGDNTSKENYFAADHQFSLLQSQALKWSFESLLEEERLNNLTNNCETVGRVVHASIFQRAKAQKAHAFFVEILDTNALCKALKAYKEHELRVEKEAAKAIDFD